MTVEVEATIQKNADTMRILRAGLRTHDPVVVDASYTRISEQYGKDLADVVIFDTITHLIETENWSFFDAEGNPSLLFDHVLPDVG